MNLVHLAICKFCTGSVLCNCRRLSNSACFALRKTVASYKMGGILSPNIINLVASSLRQTFALLCPSTNLLAIFSRTNPFSCHFFLCTISVEYPARVHSNTASFPFIGLLYNIPISCAPHSLHIPLKRA